MKTVDLPDNNGGVYSPEGFTRTEDGKTVVLQSMVEVDHATAAPLAPRATEATLLALKNVTDNLLLATEAIKLAVEDLNTAAIAGEVSVSNLPGTQAISAALLPLPAGASTEATLIAVKNALDALGGNTDTVEALQTAANVTLKTLAAYNDSVETLLTAIGSNSDGLETLLSTLGLQTDQVESLLQEIRDKLPALIASRLPATLLSEYAEDSPHVSGDKGVFMLGLRSDSDTSTADEGDYTTLKLDEQGRLKVSSKPASYPDIIGDITAIQATIGTPVAGGAVEGDVSRASNIMAFCSGTFAGVNVSFEGSLETTGNTNWFGIQAVRSNANTIETATGALSAQPIYAWEMSVNALKRVRVRCTARTSGTQSWRFVQGTYATEPIPAAQASATQSVSGSVTLIPPTPTPLNFVSAATANLTAVKASAGTLYSINAVNLSASPRYLKLYNKASAPVVATDVPVMTIELPANLKTPTLFNFGAYGHRFATGIALALTGAAADNDATVTAVGEVKMLLDYI